jgi:dTDP-4-amino-4,6-dideoxygalactose transaminase
MGVGPREILAAGVTLARGHLARYGGSGTSSTTRFERELAEHTGAKHVLAVNSGTSALTCGLVGLGVGPGDEVLVPAYTFVASAASVLGAGAVPVTVDIDASLMMDPEDVRRKITERTKAIMPVHMLNLVCDMDSLMAIADEAGLVVVEDAAQAAGARYRGRAVGTIGHAGAFSFNQHKNLKSGEGGALLTDDARVYTRAAMFHDVGNYIRGVESVSDEPLFAGYNLRMSELTSSVLRPQLARLDRLMATRRRRTLYVLDVLERHPGVVPVPHHDPDNAVGVAIRCSSAAHAKRLQEVRGVFRLFDTGRHVHTNWEPVLARRSHHPSIDPWAWAYGSPDAAPSVDCPNVIDILERTCAIIIDPEIPGPSFRRMVSNLCDAVDRLDRTPEVPWSGAERVEGDPEDVSAGSPDSSNAPSAAS